MIKAFIFDFFGVIRTDTYEAWLALNGLKREGDYFEVARLQDIGHITNDEFYERLSKIHGKSVVRADFDACAKIHHDTLELISKLKRDYSIAVLSNSPGPTLRSIIENNNLDSYFDEVFISGEINMVKPSREIFEYALDKLKLNSNEVIFIDDNQKNVEAAEQLGIKSIKFNSASELQNDLVTLGIEL